MTHPDAKVVAMLGDLDCMALFNLLADLHGGEMQKRLHSLALSAYENNEITAAQIIELWNDQAEAA